MSSNRLTYIPESIVGCKKLRVLACNSNLIADLPLALAQLPALSNVNAANNCIVRLPAILARRWRSALPGPLVDACIEADETADADVPLPTSPSTTLIVLDRNPILAGAELVPAIAASQIGQQSIVEELRGRKKVKQ